MIIIEFCINRNVKNIHIYKERDILNYKKNIHDIKKKLYILSSIIRYIFYLDLFFTGHLYNVLYCKSISVI